MQGEYYMWQPNGDCIIIERFKRESSLVMPDSITNQEGDIFIIKAVGCGYVTDHGVIIQPEVRVGDKVIIKGKILIIKPGNEEFLLARAQDVLCYERTSDEGIFTAGS